MLPVIGRSIVMKITFYVENNSKISYKTQSNFQQHQDKDSPTSSIFFFLMLQVMSLMTLFNPVVAILFYYIEPCLYLRKKSNGYTH